jgi:multiple sugar transport system ATP-binding protein
MATVLLKGITKVFDHGVVALEDLNLEVREGEFLTILGPSGSGKSTALRIIAGLEMHDAGEVCFDGCNVNRVPPQGREVAFVFQSYALYPHMNVFENIAVGLRLKGMAKGLIEERVGEVADLLEIAHLLNRKPKALSGGQRQRVALARAIAKRPRVFLLDEPLSNLDAVLRERMRVELKALFGKLKATVIYVTHDQVEALSLSDKIAVIDKGRIRQLGTPEELYEKPADLFVARFIGSPRINVFRVRIDGKHFLYGSEKWHIPHQYSGIFQGREEVIVGVRPEDIYIHKERKEPGFPVRLLMSEKLGNVLVFNVEWQGIILRVSSTRKKDDTRGNGLCIEFDRDRLLFFDPVTEKLLGDEGGTEASTT